MKIQNIPTLIFEAILAVLFLALVAAVWLVERAMEIKRRRSWWRGPDDEDEDDEEAEHPLA
jgi:membrane-anchored protein YejM (alkaline phosphatase superfamily)